MDGKSYIKRLIKLIVNNWLIVENYLFSTSIHIIGPFIGIIIYPYVIRAVGQEAYGTYVFGLSITHYFITLCSFGFTMPAIRSLAVSRHSIRTKSVIVSKFLSAKIYIGLLSAVIFFILIGTIPFLAKNKFMYAACFMQLAGEVFFPVWYFQGILKMKYVTYIQLGYRILSIPFILLMVKTHDDGIVYASIIGVSVIAGALHGLYVIRYKEKLRIRILPLNRINGIFSEGLPFFLSSATGTIKESGVSIIIGVFLNMNQLALYDLANKIILIPRTFTMQINNVIFPKMMVDGTREVVRKIIRIETLIALAISVLIILFGRWIIFLMGGTEMMDAYASTVILSFTILVWLVVGSYISFVFVPSNKYYYATRNQIVALLSFLLYAVVGLGISPSVEALAVAITLSGFTEIVYCRYLIAKHRLL
jgi:PST family polysaccharide transporter